MSDGVLSDGCLTGWGMCAYKDWLVAFNGVYTLALERIELELVMLGIIRAIVLFSYVILWVEYFMNAALLFPLHHDLNILWFNLFKHELIVAVFVIDNLQLLLKLGHVIILSLLLFDGGIVLPFWRSLILIGYIILVEVDSFTDVLGAVLVDGFLWSFWGLEDGEGVVLHLILCGLLCLDQASYNCFFYI